MESSTSALHSSLVSTEVQPSGQGPGTYKLLAKTKEEEDQFDFVKFRNNNKPLGVMGSTAHLIKGALGAGVLTGHVAYMKAGVGMAMPLNIVAGIYMGYCLHVLIQAAQVLYKRTRVASLTYSDVGEAAMACASSHTMNKFSYAFRVMIDTMVCMDLFGSCACYQIIIAKSIKQLVENTHETTFYGRDGLPNLRVYMALMIIPVILICWIYELKWLAPFSFGGNFIILFCVFMAIYYGLKENPNLENLVFFTHFYHLFEFLGMSVYSMSCAGIVIPIENKMKDPTKFPLALAMGMVMVVCATSLISFFGYVGYLDQCESPITVNFPMQIFPIILKASICVMLYVTHALNFFVPFSIAFSYIKKLHQGTTPRQMLYWELFYRAAIVLIIAVVAILFPNIDNLVGFIGSFCLSNMAFICPNIIRILVIWERPGFGKGHWRLWWHIFLLAIGMILLTCGTYINGYELFRTSVQIQK